MGNFCYSSNLVNDSTDKIINMKPSNEQQRPTTIKNQLESSNFNQNYSSPFLSDLIYSEINHKTFEFFNKDSKTLRRSSELLKFCLNTKSICDWIHTTSFPHQNSHMFHLFRDQTLIKTRTNKSIIQIQTNHVFNRKKIEEMRSNFNQLPPDTALIIVPPFSNFDMIVPGIYQTGITGIVLENMLECKIKVIINATYEMPLLKHPSIISFRVPVDDDANEQINEYFDDVADLMEAARLKGYSSVVHCMAGVSRSATLILAYMIKYTTFTLFEAFLHVKSIRNPIRPNIGFLQQLIKYERIVRGRQSIDLEEIQIDKHQKVLVPKFYRSHYPELFDMEINRQIMYTKMKLTKCEK